LLHYILHILCILNNNFGNFILPLDLLPDITPIIGFTDDIAALIACTKSIISNCTAEVKERAEQKVNEWFGEIKSE